MNSNIKKPSFLLQVSDPEEEVCDWLENNVDESFPANKITSAILRSWMKIDEREKLSALPPLRDYPFCSANLAIAVARFEFDFSNMVLSKQLSTYDLSDIRRIYNPFEDIGNAGFRSRKTVKAANMDYLVRYTEPLDQQGNPLIDNDDEGLCYSDIYGDPDGFVEYIEWRRRSQNKKTTKLDISSMRHGLKSESSFRIYAPLIIDRFIEYVRNSDVGAGLHLLCVDFYKEGIHFRVPEGAGISTETFFKHSTLSYCLLALNLLRPNGTFIMKVITSQKLFTVGLLYLMYRCFDKISLVMPNSCRPDNTEEYLICKWKKPGDHTEIVRQYLYDVNMKLNDVKDTNSDVIQLVPFEVLKEDKTFFEYVYSKNDKMLQRGLVWLQCFKLNFGSDITYNDPRKTDFKQRCSRLWDIPEKDNYSIRKFKTPDTDNNWRRKDDGATTSSAINNRNTPKDVRGAQSSNYKFENWRRKDGDCAAGKDNWRKRKE